MNECEYIITNVQILPNPVDVNGTLYIAVTLTRR